MILVVTVVPSPLMTVKRKNYQKIQPGKKLYFRSYNMRTNLPKILDVLIFCIYSLNFSLEFFIMIFFVTNQVNVSKFLPPQIRKTLISY